MSETTPPMNVVIRHDQQDDNGAQQWKRAREILEDMRKKRTSLALTGHAHPQQQQDDYHPSSPSISKLGPLGTVNENESCETEGDRARDILERMRKRRESFSQLLIGVGHASPTPTKHSLTRTESTAAISWVSSTTEEEEEAVTYIFSEEEASNSCYEDYPRYHGTDVDSLSSHCSISSSSISAAGASFLSSGGSTSASSSLLSDISFQNSVLQALDDIKHYDMRSTNIPSALTAVPLSVELSCPEKRLVLQRKTSGTSRARNLYQDGNTQNKSYQFLKTERHAGPATTRLRADLAAISERRTMLTSILDSVQQLKSQEIDFSVVASTILSTSTTAASPDNEEEESGADSKPLALPMARLEMATPEQMASRPPPSNRGPIHFDGGRWSDKDARPEDRIQPFGFPFSDLPWAGANSDASFESGNDNGNIEWDTSNRLALLTREDSTMRGSMYLSEASSTEASESASLPLHIEFEVKATPLTEAVVEPTKALRSAEYLKALYSPRPEEAIQAVEEHRYGGLYQLAQWTQDVERLTDRSHAMRNRRNLPKDDFMIPYNVEDRFAGGLYHIAVATQTRPTTVTNRATI